MRSIVYALTVAASTVIVKAATLNDVCTTAYVQASLPADGFYQGISLNAASVTANPVTNASASGSVFFPDATFDYCNVTLSYSHNGMSDKVNLEFWFPTPANFQNRWLSTGGGGYAINSGAMSLPGGISYGAAAGITDGGFGGVNTQFDSVFFLANGTINYPALYI